MSNNFNDARKKAIEAYKSLVKTLNENHRNGFIVMSSDGIEESLDDLCASLMVIGSAYVSGNDGFSRLIEEDKTLPIFNPNR